MEDTDLVDVEWDMVRCGDMLGPRLGAKVATHSETQAAEITSLRTALASAEAKLEAMQKALGYAASAMEAEAVVLECAQLAPSCAAALVRKARAARLALQDGGKDG